MSGVGNNLNTSQRQQQSGAPFTIGSAVNGLSVDALGRIVLGQDVGAVGDPAQLLNNREIPLFGHTLEATQGGNPRLFIDPTNDVYGLGDINAATSGTFFYVDNNFMDIELNSRSVLFANKTSNVYGFGDLTPSNNGFQLQIDDGASTWHLGIIPANAPMLFHDLAVSMEMMFIDSLGTPRLNIPDAAGGITQMVSDDFLSMLQLANAANGGLALIGNAGGVIISANQNNLTANIQGANNGIFFGGDAFLIHMTTALSNNAGANIGTLNNAPTAGNPAKWIAIDDNGTTRKIPTWL